MFQKPSNCTILSCLTIVFLSETVRIFSGDCELVGTGTVVGFVEIGEEHFVTLTNIKTLYKYNPKFHKNSLFDPLKRFVPLLSQCYKVFSNS
jgi:hypothetical protein